MFKDKPQDHKNKMFVTGMEFLLYIIRHKLIVQCRPHEM